MTPVTGHFGEWLQGRLGPTGPMALVTMPCNALWATPAITPDQGINRFDPALLQQFLCNLGLTAAHLPAIKTNMPLGGGAGGSTAYLVALARACGYDGPPQSLADACLAAEGAVDPLMFAQADQILWDSRRAQMLDQLPPPPSAQIIGGFGSDPVFTDPKDYNFDDITEWLSDWRAACAQRDLPRAAQIATRSAQSRAARLKSAEPIFYLARDLGALGVVMAHTGSARGLIFAPNSAPKSTAAALATAGLNTVTSFHTGSAS